MPDVLTRDECIQWLSEQDLDALDAPALVREETARLLGNLGVKPQEALPDEAGGDPRAATSH